jgi:uncharacterized protein YpuA (DUF1002 family)
MAKKNEEKERAIESFSKDVLVHYLKTELVIVSRARLRIIELDIDYNKLSAEIKETLQQIEKASNAKSLVKYHQLQIKYERLQRRMDKLLKF